MPEKRPPSISTFAVIVATTCAGLGWMLYVFLNSPGVPVHDELVHVFIARDAWHSTADVLDVWGRVVNTILYMPGALLGLAGARAESVLFSLITALLTLLLARRLGVKYLLVVPALLWFQPWFSDLGYTCTTEVPFMMVMVGACCLLAGDSLVGAALLAGLLPLIRHEGIAFAGIIALWALYRKRWAAAALAFAPLVAYNVVHAAVLGVWPIAIYFQPKPTEHYGAGPLAHFIPALAAGAGLPVLVLAANAIAPAAATAKRALVLGLYALYFVIHAVIFRFGLFASGGYGVFLLPLAPGLAVAAALGLEFILDGGRKALEALKWPPGRIVLAGRVFAAVAIALVLVMGFETKPRPLEPEGQLMKSVAEWLEKSGLDKGPVYTTDPWLHEFMPTKTNRAPYLPKTPGEMEPGAIVVWDFHYSDRYGLKKDELKDPSRWELLQQTPDGAVAIYRKRF